MKILRAQIHHLLSRPNNERDRKKLHFWCPFLTGIKRNEWGRERVDFIAQRGRRRGAQLFPCHHPYKHNGVGGEVEEEKWRYDFRGTIYRVCASGFSIPSPLHPPPPQPEVTLTRNGEKGRRVPLRLNLHINLQKRENSSGKFQRFLSINLASPS